MTVYRTGDETVEFLAGQSGEALQSVEAAVSEEDAGDGWTRAVYEIAALPDQTDFLEIRAEGGIVISNVSLDYKPDNSPIQKIRFDDSALDAIADYAWQANETAENIGARRLHTLLEKILNDIAFNAGGGDAPEVEVKVDAEYVRGQLSDDMQSKDVKKYIL